MLPFFILISLPWNRFPRHSVFQCTDPGFTQVLDETRAENEPEGASQNLRQLYQFLHCSNLNTVMAIIACTQTTEKVFHAFIFKEKREANKLIWSRIVDREKVLEFPLLVGREVGHRKHWVGGLRQQDFSGRIAEPDANSFLSN